MSSGTRSKTKLSSRFLVYYALTYLALIGLMGFIIDRSTRSELISGLDDNLAIAARLARENLPADPADYQAWAETTFEASGFRTTLIGEDGVVLADSHSDPEDMENHLTRPEVQIALSGEIGVANRISASTGFDQRYVALPPRRGLIVRTSVPARVIDDELGNIRLVILSTTGTLGLIGVVVVA
ncbi:MAG: hypothetical protein ACRDU9_04400, partial [Acidimicrobiia bacterium]